MSVTCMIYLNDDDLAYVLYDGLHETAVVIAD